MGYRLVISVVFERILFRILFKDFNSQVIGYISCEATS